jgi:hypothetical protein
MQAGLPDSRQGVRPGHLVPDSKSFASESPVFSSGEQVAARSDMRADDSVHLDEALRVVRELELTHASLALTGGLMGVLGAVVQIPMLPVSNTRYHNSFRGGVAAQLVGNERPAQRSKL